MDDWFEMRNTLSQSAQEAELTKEGLSSTSFSKDKVAQTLPDPFRNTVEIEFSDVDKTDRSFSPSDYFGNGRGVTALECTQDAVKRMDGSRAAKRSFSENDRCDDSDSWKQTLVNRLMLKGPRTKDGSEPSPRESERKKIVEQALEQLEKLKSETAAPARPKTRAELLSETLMELLNKMNEPTERRPIDAGRRSSTANFDTR